MKGVDATNWLSLLPAGCVLLIITSAAVFFGADIPAAKAYFASALLLSTALAALWLNGQVPTVGAWAGAMGLSGFALHSALVGSLDTAGPDLGALAAALAIWMIARNLSRQPGAGVMMWRASLALGSLIALWAFWDFMLARDVLWGVDRPYHRDRLAGGFLSANTAATFFGLISLMGLCELLVQINRVAASLEAFSRNALALSLSLIATLLPASCLILTASRAGIAFTGFAALLMTGWQVYSWTRHGNSRRRSLGLALGAGAAFIVVAGLVWTVSGEFAASRFERLMDDTARQTMFEAYWQAVRLAPLWGHGLGSFDFVNALIATSPNARVLSNQGAAHNVYLQWLLQAGWIGTIFAAGGVFGLLAIVVRGLRHRRKERAYLRATICISLLVFLHGLTDYALEVPGFMWSWAWVLGLGAGIASAGRSQRQAEMNQDAARSAVMVWAPRLLFVALALSASGWIALQGQMRLDANTAYRLSPEAIAAIAAKERLPASAYLREALAARAIEPDINDLQFAARATLAALDREPRLLTAWNRLVYIDLASHGRLTSEGRAALSQSLYLSPYGTAEVMRWRLQIAAITWADLEGDARRQLLSQALVLSQFPAERRWLNDFIEQAPADMRSAMQAMLGA